MKYKIQARLAALCLCLCLLFGVQPGDRAYAALSREDDGIDFDALTNGLFYYGVYDHATSLSEGDFGTPTKEGVERPILWRLMGKEDGDLALMSEYVLDSKQMNSNRGGEQAQNIAQSELNRWLHSTFLYGAFSPVERDAVLSKETQIEMCDNLTGNPMRNQTYYPPEAYGLTGNKISDNSSDINTGPWPKTSYFKIYLPSAIFKFKKVFWEAGATMDSAYQVGDFTATLRNKADHVLYWLRNPSPNCSDLIYTTYITKITAKPYYDIGAKSVIFQVGVRPIFQLRPSSILFASKVVSLADPSKGETQKDENYSKEGAYKLTIENSALTVPSFPGRRPGTTMGIDPGGSLTLTDTAGITGRLAYKIVEESGGVRSIVGYGIADPATPTQLTVNSTANLLRDAPALSADGNYTLYVWSQIDHATNSNEGSMPVWYSLRTDTTAPTVQSVTPSGTDAEIDGSIDVAFSEAMRTDVGGVSLDGGVTRLTGGSWNADGTVYTVDYTGLDWKTDYTVTLLDFQDLADKLLTPNPDASHSFTTRAKPPGPFHIITAGAGEGGRISPSGAVSVQEGESRTFAIRRDAGYQIDDVLVDGVSVGAVSSYTFPNVAGPHTIEASFVKGGGAAFPTGGRSYAARTLTDPATGVTVQGSFTADASLSVRDALPHEPGACPACDALRVRQEKGELLALYDVSLGFGDWEGEIEVSIPVGEQYNGRTVVLLHGRDDGTLESRTLRVENGVAKGRFSSLSPFAVALSDGSAGADDDANPQTGADAGLAPLLSAALAGAALLAGGVRRLRKRRG